MNDDFRAASSVPEPKEGAPPGADPLSDQGRADAHSAIAAEGQNSPQARTNATPNGGPPAGTQTAPPATDNPVPIEGTLEGHETSPGHKRSDPQAIPAGAADIPGGHTSSDDQRAPAAGEQIPPATAIPVPVSIAVAPWLADHDADLAAAADVLHDLEKVRIASENRLRQFTRPEDAEDKDGKTGRGFGWDIRSPAVQSLAGIVAGMKCDSDVVLEALGEDKAPAKAKGCCLEHDAERNLTRALRAHPLGPWVRAAKGVGEKQGGRLIASLGDPYIRHAMKLADGSVEPSRPRTVSELWAYAGYHTVDGAAAKRAKGVRANWSSAAKMRAYLVAEKCMQSGVDRGTCPKENDGPEFTVHSPECRCSPYRVFYDAQRVRLAGAVHPRPCPQCGPKGKPAQPGSPLSLGHKKGYALRLTAKEILKDLWREAKRLHEEQAS